jgi:hypothetical protein
MIQTEGYKFSPGSGAQFSMAQPTPLQFVDGRSLVPEVAMPTDVGQSFVAEASQAATSSLLAGIGVGLEGIIGGINTIVKEKYAEEKAEKQHQRDLEIVRERARLGDVLSPYEEARLDYLKSQTKKLDQELEGGDPYSEWTGGEENIPKSYDLGETPAPSPLAGDPSRPLIDVPGVIEPPLPEDKDKPLEPPLEGTDERLPDVVTPPSAPLADTSGPRKIVQSGPILQIPLEDGGTWIIDTEQAARGKTTGRYVGPGLATPEDVQVPGFETTRMTVGPNGRVSRTMEPTPKEGAAEWTKDQLEAWNKIENRAKANTSIQNANDALASRDIIGSNLSKKNGLSDITAINAFQRMVDPGVAVREGDVALIQQAIPRLQRFGLKAQNWVVGDQLSPEVRKQMIEAADAMLESRVRAANPAIEELRGVAKAAGLNPDMAIKPPKLPESLTLKSQIEAMAEELDSMEDKNSQEFRAKREELKKLVQRQNQLEQ